MRKIAEGSFSWDDPEGGEPSSGNRPQDLGFDFSSGILSSSSLVQGHDCEENDFRLLVHTELIVFGVTEPDAELTIQGKPVRLRPDGTFSIRFALPDGEQVIPVRATSVDGDTTRVVTPIIQRETQADKS